ncbi:MAG: phosphate ABC transporter permease subunit PstC [Lentisphaeria bacterium]
MSQLFNILLMLVLPVLILGYLLGYFKAASGIKRGETFHSTPSYCGWYAVVWMLWPTVLILLASCFLHLFGIFTVPAPYLITALIIGFGSLFIARAKITPELHAYHFVEKFIYVILVSAAIVSVLTTVGILLSVLFESIRFFKQVSVWEFITGTQWSPDTAFLGSAGRGGEQIAKPEFGSLPLFAGTFMITLIAMLVAIPVGLLSAIAMAEYSALPVRRIAKPALEILAGIPTVVYGFFAAVTVSPLVVQAAAEFNIEADYTNALAPGLVMGIMIIPLISSLCDDVIMAVPQSLKGGSYALGATHAETIKKVLLPAALPGIVSAFLLAVSRAVGETMIVVMAAGLRPNLTWNPLEGMTTVTVSIVDSLTGDQSFDSAATLSAFALGLVLLIFTLCLNIVSAIIIRKFRNQYTD